MVRTYPFNPSTQAYGESLPCVRRPAGPVVLNDTPGSIGLAGQLAQARQPDDRYERSPIIPNDIGSPAGLKILTDTSPNECLNDFARPNSLVESASLKNSYTHFQTSSNDLVSSEGLSAINILPSKTLARRTPLPSKSHIESHNQINGNAVAASGRVARLLPAVAKSIAQWNFNLPTVSTVVEDETTVLGIRCIRIDGQRFYQPIEIQSDNQQQQQNQQQIVHNQKIQQQQRFKQQKSSDMDSGVSSSSTMSSCLSGETFSRPVKIDQTKNWAEETSSQDSGYQCGSLEAGPTANCSLSKHSRNDAFSTAISLLTHNSKSAHAVDDSTQETYRTLENATIKWPTIEPAYHKSASNLDKSENRASAEIFDKWPLAQSITTVSFNNTVGSEPRAGKMSWASVSSANISAATDKSTRPNACDSFYADPSYQQSSQSAFNLAQFGRSAEQRDQFAKEQHKMELLRQIEDNKRRKMLEKQREWEADERERVKNELYQQRVRLELEEECRKEREKDLIAERKAQQRVATQQAAAERLAEEKVRRQQRPSESTTLSLDDSTKKPVHENRPSSPEWWEKKRTARNGGAISPVIPALRGTAAAASSADDRPLPKFNRNLQSPQGSHDGLTDHRNNQKTHQNDVDLDQNSIDEDNDENEDFGAMSQASQASRTTSRRSRSFSNSTGSYRSEKNVPKRLPRQRYDYDDEASALTSLSSTKTSSTSYSTKKRLLKTRPQARSYSRSNRRSGYRSSIEQAKEKLKSKPSLRPAAGKYNDVVDRYGDDNENDDYNEDKDEIDITRNSPVFRRLSVTRRHKGDRVYAAIRANNYGAHLFDD